jgi:HSP20 family molecular chaperone IbpA
VALPEDVDGGKAKARLEDGLLEVTVPKSGKSARRSIKVE